MGLNRRRVLGGTLACACCGNAGAARAEAGGHGSNGGLPAAHWSYEGEAAPEHWGGLQSDFQVCKLGLEQSPIDLGESIKGSTSEVAYDYKSVPLRVVNNCHTIQVNAESGSASVIDDLRFELLEVQFHHPSEHLLAGKALDLECHRVQGQARVRSLSRACSLVATPNAALKLLFDCMPQAQGAEVRIAGLIDVAALLARSAGYFRYMGSLTTPPCSAGLTRTVYKETIKAPVEQFQ